MFDKVAYRTISVSWDGDLYDIFSVLGLVTYSTTLTI